MSVSNYFISRQSYACVDGYTVHTAKSTLIRFTCVISTDLCAFEPFSAKDGFIVFPL